MRAGRVHMGVCRNGSSRVSCRYPAAWAWPRPTRNRYRGCTWPDLRVNGLSAPATNENGPRHGARFGSSALPAPPPATGKRFVRLRQKSGRPQSIRPYCSRSTSGDLLLPVGTAYQRLTDDLLGDPHMGAGRYPSSPRWAACCHGPGQKRSEHAVLGGQDVRIREVVPAATGGSLLDFSMISPPRGLRRPECGELSGVPTSSMWADLATGGVVT